MSRLKNLMSKVNAWIEKVGVDKLLHFFVAAWVVSECKAYGVGAGCIAWVVMVVLSWLKEELMDECADASDIFASACGGFVSIVLMVVCSMFVL